MVQRDDQGQAREFFFRVELFEARLALILGYSFTSPKSDQH